MSVSRYKKWMSEAFINEADDDNYVHVGGGKYKEVNKRTGEPLPNSPTYIKKDSGGYEMVDDDDPRLSKDDDKEKKTPVSIDIDAAGGLGGKEESIKVINGKKYRAIQESVNKRISVKEVKYWLKGLEEYRYRKIPGVDARRITSFINNGLNETDLPISLQKKWEHAKYSKEKGLADRFIKQRISQKLTQTESKHPIKENYDRLFTKTNESDFIDEGIIDDLLKKIVAKISSSDQKTVKQLSKRDPKFAKAYKQFIKARSDLESSLRTNKGFYASI